MVPCFVQIGHTPMAASARSSIGLSLFLFAVYVWYVASSKLGILPRLHRQDPQQVCFFFCFLSLYGAFLCPDWVYAHGCVIKILNRSLSFCMVHCFIQIGYTPMAASARSSASLSLFLFALFVWYLASNWVYMPMAVSVRPSTSFGLFMLLGGMLLHHIWRMCNGVCMLSLIHI